MEASDETKRRKSGPTWQMAHEPALGNPHTSGHVVSSSSTAQHTHSGRHTLWNHPYQSSTHSSLQYRHLARHDDTPSPLSSDSDSLPPHNSAHSPSHPFSHGMQTTGPRDSHARPSEIAFTPSTSPFLGPLRTLNLQSAHTSRAPSPILLPPPSIGSGIVADGSISPIDEPSRAYGPRSRRTSVAGSPPNGSVHNRPTVRRKGINDDRLYNLSSLPRTHTYPSQLSQLTEKGPPSTIHTPQLSSGPSSDASSPTSVSYPLSITAQSPSAPFHFDSGSGTPSATNSRPSSPSHWQHSSHQSHPGRDSSWGGSNNHLAHSVRKAFGMTPIYPPPRNTSWPSSFSARAHSGSSTPAEPSNIFSLSVPTSRSGSPPITLPPLKLSSALSIPSQRSLNGEDGTCDDDSETPRGAKRIQRTERLPGFSEFEAASCPPSMNSR
jgi:zinc-finger protein CreA/MIG